MSRGVSVGGGSEADNRYLAEIGEDCLDLLGPGIELLGLDREDVDDTVRLVARYRFAGRLAQSAASGETVVAAHAALRERIVFDRVRLGFEAVAWRPAR